MRKLSHLSFIAFALAFAAGPISASVETRYWRALRCDPERDWATNVHVAAVPASRAEPVSQANGAAGYWAWARQVFSAAELADPLVSGPDAEYLYDGVSNVTKYAFGFGPGDDCSAVLGETTQVGEHWFFHYDRPTDVADVQFRVEVSTDFMTWSGEGVTQEPILAVEGVESWQAQFEPPAGAAVFFRFVTTLR